MKEKVVNVTDQQQERLDEISLNVNSLAEKQILNGNDLSNLTYFYSELVELSKSYLNINNLNDPETSKQLMESLESEMNNLQNKKIQEAITKLKTYIDKSDDENQKTLSSIEKNLDLLMPELPEFLRKGFLKEKSIRSYPLGKP